MITEYPLSVVFSTRSRCMACMRYLYCTSHCQTNSCNLAQELSKERATSSTMRDSPVFPEVGSMTTLFPGMSFPSCSATSIMRFAILSFTEPPGEVHSSFPTEGRRPLCLSDPTMRRRDQRHSRRLHLRPSCLAILSRRMRGVFPTASRTDSRTVDISRRKGKRDDRLVRVKREREEWTCWQVSNDRWPGVTLPGRISTN